jgi:hypothetical protein
MAERIEERLPPLPTENAPASTDERPSSPTPPDQPGGDRRVTPPRLSPLSPGGGDQSKRRSR